MKKPFYLLLVSIGVIVLASIFASSFPDGLERVGEGLGFLGKVQSTFSLLPNYTLPFIRNTFISTSLAGLIGVLFIYGIFALVRKTLIRFDGQQSQKHQQ